MATTAAKNLLDKYGDILQTYGRIRSDCIDLSAIIDNLLLKLSNLPLGLNAALKHTSSTEQKNDSEAYTKSLRHVVSHASAVKKHLETLQSKLDNHVGVIDRHVERHKGDQAILDFSITRFESGLPFDEAQANSAFRNIPVRIKDAKYYAERAIQHIKFIEEHLARLIGELEKLKDIGKDPSLETPIKEIDYFCEEFALEFATCALISKVIQERIELLDKISFKTPLEKKLDEQFTQDEPRRMETSPISDSPFIVDSREIETVIKS